MGFFSSFSGSLGGGVGSGLTTGINNHLRYVDRNFLGGMLGIDDANSTYLYEDTYNSALANYNAQADSMGRLVKAQRAALVDNGYNPLLAIGGVEHPSAFSGQAISPSFGGGSADYNEDVREANIKLLKEQTNIARSEAASARAQSKADISAARLDRELDDARLEALQSLDYDSDSKTRVDFKQAYRNAIERDRFVNSREHAVAEDAVNLIHGGSSAFSNIAHGMRAVRDRRSRK